MTKETFLNPVSMVPAPRPATSGDIQYKAYQRPYDVGGGQVITLLASCSYTTGNYHIFFAGDGAHGNYVLMEQPPVYYFDLTIYYSATFCSGIGLGEPLTSVSIKDAYGTHQVPLENI